jgi:hypothetical protein
MTKKEIQERIDNALILELASIYTQLGIEGGDISPWDSLEWDRVTEEIATLFQALIAWNTDEE